MLCQGKVIQRCWFEYDGGKTWPSDKPRFKRPSSECNSVGAGSWNPPELKMQVVMQSNLHERWRYLAISSIRRARLNCWNCFGTLDVTYIAEWPFVTSGDDRTFNGHLFCGDWSSSILLDWTFTSHHQVIDASLQHSFDTVTMNVSTGYLVDELMDQAKDASDDRRMVAVSVAVICLILIWIIVLLRFVARWRSAMQYGWDDWAVGFALVSSIIMKCEFECWYCTPVLEHWIYSRCCSLSVFRPYPWSQMINEITSFQFWWWSTCNLDATGSWEGGRV